jgi:hypothetical protein
VPAWMEDLKLVDDAIHRDGILPDSKREFLIAETGISIVATLLRKNRDYGGSAFEPPVLMPAAGADAGILVRMSDKIHRLKRLLGGATQFVLNESLVDTFKDLAGYAILWIVSQYLAKKAAENAPSILSGHDPGSASRSATSGFLTSSGDYPQVSPWSGTDKVHS